ncbi:LOW QUALITY PROTEIN: large ribosomal subunit protein P2-like [Macrobrachium nipponense]|uniref:LOW QUALITY PROTEIN: large ribosomal subunit protein P2-like n=1 Tax=Macrobrachium nipponense TaxID=159736 RepID=UPI0030C85222
MRHVAAYLLALMSGKEVTAGAIKDILGSVGVEADEKQLDVLLKNFAGKNVNDLISLGATMLSSMPARYCRGGGGGGAGGAPAAGGGGAAAAAEEKEEKKEEPEEESDDDMGFGLFD